VVEGPSQGCEPPKISLLRGWVNKGYEEGLDCYTPALQEWLVERSLPQKAFALLTPLSVGLLLELRLRRRKIPLANLDELPLLVDPAGRGKKKARLSWPETLKAVKDGWRHRLCSIDTGERSAGSPDRRS
jgi:hypothetical protein